MSSLYTPVPSTETNDFAYYASQRRQSARSNSQATKGDVEGKQPWAVQIEARAKWDWWAKLKGMSKEEAMQHYIDLLGDPEVWENHDMLKTQYKPEEFNLSAV